MELNWTFGVGYYFWLKWISNKKIQIGENVFNLVIFKFVEILFGLVFSFICPEYSDAVSQ